MNNYIELFAGIGGMSHGLTKAGWNCVGYVEMDKYAHQSFEILHDPEKKLWSGYDVRSVSDGSIRNIRERTGGEFNLSLGDFLAKASQSLGSVKDLLTKQGELSSLKSSGSHLFSNLEIYFLKTSKDYSPTTMEQLLKPLSARWMKWGMTLNGKCITARPTFPKIESGSSLSDILEDSVPEKYFLSDEKTASLLKSLDESNVKATTISSESTELGG